MSVLVLIVPFGLDRQIYPWGVHLIKDYIQSSCNNVDIDIWDLRHDNVFQSISEKNKLMVDEMEQLFTGRGERKVLGFQSKLDPSRKTAHSGYVFSVLSRCGKDALLGQLSTIAEKRLVEKYSAQLDCLQDDFFSYITNKVSYYRSKNSGRKIIFGISVFDYTLFEALHIGSSIKKICKSSSIILGGDHFNEQTAIEVYKKSEWLDGIVVGFGEDVVKYVVDYLEQGFLLSQISLKGFINSSNLHEDKQSFSVPPYYTDHHGDLPASPVVYDSENNRINILPYRGCDWGHCTFCRNTDRHLGFGLGESWIKTKTIKILEKIKRNRSESSNEGPKEIFIRIDSDSNEPPALINILDPILDENFGFSFNVFFWLRTLHIEKYFDFISFLVSKMKTGVRFKISMGVESLNPKTLKDMWKGVTPLHNLLAIKALKDISVIPQFNYFMNFPLEDKESVKEEIYFIKNSLHLLCPPTSVSILKYMANNRDFIYNNQEKFGVNITPINDWWLKYFFNVDLPCWANAVSYSLRATKESEIDPVKEYFEFVNNKFSFSYLADSPQKVVQYIRESINDPVFLERALLYLKLIQWSGFMNAEREDTAEIPLFYLENQKLIKQYPPPFYESWTINLDQIEIEILKHLYKPDSYQEVVNTFTKKYGHSRVVNTLEKHIQMKSILRYKTKLLSIFNDPEFHFPVNRAKTGRKTLVVF